MRIFSNFFKGRDAPVNRTSGSAYSFFMGGSTSGKRVNERTAMQMTAVYSCVRILSEAVAGLPLQFYRYTADGGKEKAVDHPLYFLLHDEPNPEMTSFVFRETLMTHLLLWGNAYSQIIRNARGEIIALYPLMPDRMTVNRDENGQLYYEYYMNTDDAHTMKGTTVRLQPHDVLHILGLGFDGLVGYSPIAMAKNAIGMAIARSERMVTRDIQRGKRAALDETRFLPSDSAVQCYLLSKQGLSKEEIAKTVGVNEKNIGAYVRLVIKYVESREKEDWGYKKEHCIWYLGVYDGLSARLTNILTRADFKSIDEFKGMSTADLAMIPGLTKGRIETLVQFCREKGIAIEATGKCEEQKIQGSELELG